MTSDYSLKRQKIAIIGSKGIPSHVSGLEVYVQNIAVELADKAEVVVFCRKRYCDQILNEYKGVKVRYVPSINTKHLDAFSYTILAACMAVCGNFDVFWYHAMGTSISMPIPAIFNKRIICTVHGLDWKREKFGRFASAVLKFGEKCIAKYAEEIITLNKDDQLHFKEKWGRNTLTINNGVVIPLYKKLSEASEKYDIHKDGYYLFMSRIVPEKEVHTLINAYIHAGIGRKLVIAGSGVHSSSYEKKVKQLAADNKDIIFVGDVFGELKEELYSNAYAYILPSSIEGQSIGLLEAMSYGLPCIISNIPENMSVVRDAGITFLVKDENSLRDALLYAEKEKNEIKKCGKKAFEIVTKDYSNNEFVKKTMKVVLGG
ncbi:glycosyltransferase family 4 protein [Butyrivibrio sp.]|uniref:glycosyltransferase family 4 protein n=1 Tax=Butyrivibrio sp. TaxID=28121 RepID=UPI0025BDE6DA|nr:glycosyltransferase family 4 protein [Butyrivibrio sp.]